MTSGGLSGFVEGLMPEADLTVTQWADSTRILSTKGSIEPGRYNSARTPYMVEIMDCLSVSSTVSDVTFAKATQLGATEGANNFIGYIIDVAPGPALLMQPTDDLAKEHSKAKMSSMFEETPSLRAKVAERKSRSSTNTILAKDFPGGFLFLSGANSPVSARNKSVRYLILDDFDGFPLEAGKEGDTGDLIEKRTDSFGARKKIYRNSTPTIKGLSQIWSHYLDSDQRSYHVACPFCGYKQKLVWGGPGERKGIKFERNKSGGVVAVWYECAKCREGIDESHKTEMLAAGGWVAKYKRREKRGYHLSSLYSPLGWVSWKQIVEEFLKAKDKPQKLKVWKNTRMAEVFDEEGSQPEWKLLRDRAEYYQIRQVPDACCFITSGVDVQKDRLAVVVRGWAPAEESFLVWWGELFGDTLRAPVWDQLDNVLKTPFLHATGVPFYVEQMAVDSGYRTNEVYNWCRQRAARTMATKGAATAGKAILNKPSLVDVDYQGETIKDGCQLWSVGTDTAKSQIYSRLSMTEAGGGYYHFPVGLQDEYFLQLTAEKKVTQYRNGYPKPVWVKLRDRNEALDCEELALVAALRAGMAFTNWEKLRQNRIENAGQVQSKGRQKRKKKPQQQAKRW